MYMYIPSSTSTVYFVFTLGAGPLVVRPDSGDPATTVVKVLEILGLPVQDSHIQYMYMYIYVHMAFHCPDRSMYIVHDEYSDI